MSSAEMISRITPDELLRIPDNNVMELVDGRIVEKHTSVRTCEVEGYFLFRIQIFLQVHPIAEVYPCSLGYQCFSDQPTKIRKPDMTVVRLDRLKPIVHHDLDFMPIVPDLAVEVIAPDETIYEIDNRVQEYLDAGFPLVWIANPNTRTITIYPRGSRPMFRTADDEITADAVLPGFRCKVGDFFPASDRFNKAVK